MKEVEDVEFGMEGGDSRSKGWDEFLHGGKRGGKGGRLRVGGRKGRGLKEKRVEGRGNGTIFYFCFLLTFPFQSSAFAWAIQVGSKWEGEVLAIMAV
jgi:hypothetical protein